MTIRLTCLTAACATLLAGSAAAGPLNNLVQNGTFTNLSNGYGQVVVQPDGTNVTSGTGITQATGWYASYNAGEAHNGSGNAYPFLFVANPTAVDTSGQGFPDPWDNGTRYIWGPGDGSNNGYNGASPAGGNVLVMDAGYHTQALSQNITNGLVVGDNYALTFYWAAAQWADGGGGATGATTESLGVSLGNQAFTTNTVNNSSHGFSGWMQTTWDFTYNGSSDVLSFLAAGGPGGEPPLVLLDGVTLYDTPEPAAWTVLIIGLTGLAILRRRRAAKQ